MATELKPLTELAEKSDLVVYEGITTNDGIGGTTIIDSDLIGVNDFLTGATLYITSGSADKEVTLEENKQLEEETWKIRAMYNPEFKNRYGLTPDGFLKLMHENKR